MVSHKAMKKIVKILAKDEQGLIDCLQVILEDEKEVEEYWAKATEELNKGDEDE